MCCNVWSACTISCTEWDLLDISCVSACTVHSESIQICHFLFLYAKIISRHSVPWNDKAETGHGNFFKWKKQKDNIDIRISWSTFGSDYSLSSTWIWCHKLYTPGFEDFLLFFSANPLSGWIGTMEQVWLGSSMAIHGNMVSQQFMKLSQNIN